MENHLCTLYIQQYVKREREKESSIMAKVNIDFMEKQVKAVEAEKYAAEVTSSDILVPVRA